MITQRITNDGSAFVELKAMIMPGITIGKNAVVGAKSVVTKNVKPHHIRQEIRLEKSGLTEKGDKGGRNYNLGYFSFGKDIVLPNLPDSKNISHSTSKAGAVPIGDSLRHKIIRPSHTSAPSEFIFNN